MSGTALQYLHKEQHGCKSIICGRLSTILQTAIPDLLETVVDHTVQVQYINIQVAKHFSRQHHLLQININQALKLVIDLLFHELPDNLRPRRVVLDKLLLIPIRVLLHLLDHGGNHHKEFLACIRTR